VEREFDRIRLFMEIHKPLVLKSKRLGFSGECTGWEKEVKSFENVEGLHWLIASAIKRPDVNGIFGENPKAKTAQNQLIALTNLAQLQFLTVSLRNTKARLWPFCIKNAVKS